MTWTRWKRKVRLPSGGYEHVYLHPDGRWEIRQRGVVLYRGRSPHGRSLHAAQMAVENWRARYRGSKSLSSTTTT